LKFRTAIITVFIVIITAVFFIAGKDKTVNSSPVKSGFRVAENLFFKVHKLISDKRTAKLDSTFRALNKKGVFNGTVIFAEYGEVVFEGAYGWANFRTKDTLSIDDSFQLASVSKMFTAYAVMLLKQEGKLRYDDPVQKYIPELPYPGVTVRHLLNHRSGLANYMWLADQYWNTDKPIDNEQVIDYFEKYKPNPYFNPDNGFNYSNTNYAILASVVERISGESFTVFMKERIFDPLGMDNTRILDLNGDTILSEFVPIGVPGHKTGSNYAKEMNNNYLNGVVGDKGVYSTVEDLLKFNIALDQGSIVGFAELEEAYKPGSPKISQFKDNYGFGWRLRHDMDSTVYHFGWWKGFRTFFIRDMKNQRVLIALTNTHHGVSSEVFWGIMKNDQDPDEWVKAYSDLK
jgi:CubicO group peptidase (beta-lactamase class C family)